MPVAGTETRNTTWCMCGCRGGTRIHLRDGEVRYIDGNSEHPLTQGVIGAKGSSGTMKQYSSARLPRPLKCKPGLDRAKHFVMIGTANDHHSSPVRTGYADIADEGVHIEPGTGGAP